MSDFKWCHSPKCHKDKTQDRVRGSKGSKVLRTRKVKQTQWNQDSFYKYFCSQGCMLQFVNTHMDRVVAIEPRNSPLETPINDPKKESDGYYNTTIKERVDTQAEQDYKGYRKDIYIYDTKNTQSNEPIQ